MSGFTCPVSMRLRRWRYVVPRLVVVRFVGCGVRALEGPTALMRGGLEVMERLSFQWF